MNLVRTSSAAEKHTKISVEICVWANVQKAKYLQSGLSIGYRAPWSKNIFAPPPTKTAKFVKNRRKITEEAKAKNLLFVTSVIFRRNKVRLTL